MKASSIDFPVVSQGGHSAQVDMSLLVNGYSLAVAQMGSDFILVNNPVDHAPTEATLTMTVDSVERRWNVRLPRGVSAASRRVAIAPAN
jgi:hypothetical protein